MYGPCLSPCACHTSLSYAAIPRIHHTTALAPEYSLPLPPPAPYLEPRVLGQPEAVSNCCHSVPPVGVSGHILVDRLQPNLQAGAAIGQHLCEVGREAEVGPSLDGQPNALGARLLAVPAEQQGREAVQRVVSEWAESRLACMGAAAWMCRMLLAGQHPFMLAWVALCRLMSWLPALHQPWSRRYSPPKAVKLSNAVRQGCNQLLLSSKAKQECTTSSSSAPQETLLHCPPFHTQKHPSPPDRLIYVLGCVA